MYTEQVLCISTVEFTKIISDKDRFFSLDFQGIVEQLLTKSVLRDRCSIEENMNYRQFTLQAIIKYQNTYLATTRKML